MGRPGWLRLAAPDPSGTSATTSESRPAEAGQTSVRSWRTSNGDGRLDLVTGSDDCCDHEPGIRWFRRGADGRFTAKDEIHVRVAGILAAPIAPARIISRTSLSRSIASA